MTTATKTRKPRKKVEDLKAQASFLTWKSDPKPKLEPRQKSDLSIFDQWMQGYKSHFMQDFLARHDGVLPPGIVMS